MCNVMFACACSVTFLSGEISALFSIKISDGDILEDSETFVVTINLSLLQPCVMDSDHDQPVMNII